MIGLKPTNSGKSAMAEEIQMFACTNRRGNEIGSARDPGRKKRGLGGLPTAGIKPLFRC